MITHARSRQAVPEAQIGQTFQTAYGGVAATIPANTVGELLNVPGVAAVQKDTLNQPQDDNTSFIGATTVWPSLGGSANAGSNVVVGVIDTGVWPENPFFVDHGLPAPRSAGGLVRTASSATAATWRTSARRSPATTS